ncbi:hypothetical protein AJ80_02272 [Polytolypa hystricis UAMH7299]|uniref:Uncharacterized protein n=1 Tax=Polytolypa hystricis (strain UAMH7299) TaxID=1447883 RepID=A0A2B7YPR7_POLH7|nr:hypothetical protein AJ80_02272 [Polytolypa hystricis UAMH7299]
MAATITCTHVNDDSARKHQLAPIHMHNDTVSSPFLYIPSLLGENDSTKSVYDISLSSQLADGSDTLPPGLSIGTYRKSFYTTIEVSEIGSPQQSFSPSTTEPGTMSPLSTFSETSVEDPEEARRLIKATSDPASPTATGANARKHGRKDSKSKASRSRTSSCSTSNQRSRSRSITSRSSSIARLKTAKEPSTLTRAYTQIGSLNHRKTDPFTAHRRVDRDLVSFHRDSCRLFESTDKGTENTLRNVASEGGNTNTQRLVLSERRSSLSTSLRTQTSYALGGRINNAITTSTPSSSPLLNPAQSPMSPTSVEDGLSPAPQTHHNWDPVRPDDSAAAHQTSTDDSDTYKPIPATVIDWTSPSTRRREYKAIDRSSRGVRGFWRRFAPLWCQSRERRMLFFEEGKGGKEMYEGSVRRFRMDVPDDEEEVDKAPKPVAAHIDNSLAAKSVLKWTQSIGVLSNIKKDRESWHAFNMRRTTG